jgi:hypothetical protein
MLHRTKSKSPLREKGLQRTDSDEKVAQHRAETQAVLEGTTKSTSLDVTAPTQEELRDVFNLASTLQCLHRRSDMVRAWDGIWQTCDTVSKKCNLYLQDYRFSPTTAMAAQTVACSSQGQRGGKVKWTAASSTHLSGSSLA